MRILQLFFVFSAIRRKTLSEVSATARSVLSFSNNSQGIDIPVKNCGQAGTDAYSAWEV